ncbi:MAG: cysteine hydrolase [Beijerinckiaceae bacterium]|nr:cysteine hydrolase [Beijerinckiaceae bacterium]
MNKTNIPEWVVQKVVDRRGHRHVYSSMPPSSTALVVVDLQNGFMMDGVAHSLITGAREIVPNVNAIARTLRDLGGTVVWIHNTSRPEDQKAWPIYYNELSTPERAARRHASLTPGSIGHQIWAACDVQPGDLHVNKTRFSALLPGTSDLEAILRARGIDTLLICGTSTSVCCESTARDACMLNFRTVMVSDGNAAATDEEHNATLMNFYLTFGDVMSTQETIGYLQESAKLADMRRSA